MFGLISRETLETRRRDARKGQSRLQTRVSRFSYATEHVLKTCHGLVEVFANFATRELRYKMMKNNNL